MARGSYVALVDSDLKWKSYCPAYFLPTSRIPPSGCMLLLRHHDSILPEPLKYGIMVITQVSGQSASSQQADATVVE
jgi:hypothetical protein